MNATDLEFWNRAMKIAEDCIYKARKKNKFMKNEILAICFSFRIINSSRSIEKLLELGFVHDSKSILRTMVDALIQFGASLKHPDFMDEYHMEGLDRKDRIFKKMTRSGNWNHDNFSPEQLDAQRIITEELDRKKGVNIEKLAKVLDLHFEYYHLHNSCSSEVHHLPFTMAEYIIISEDKKAVEFIESPAQEDTQLVLCAAYGCVLKLAAFLNDHFELEMEKSIELLSSEAKDWFDKDEAQLDSAKK
jgi:hypothetical protein